MRRKRREVTFEVKPGGEFPLLRHGDRARYWNEGRRQFVTVYPRPGRFRSALEWLNRPPTLVPRWCVAALFAVWAVAVVENVVEDGLLAGLWPVGLGVLVGAVWNVVVEVRRRRAAR